ncbi:uncharacterized protein [Amphiura filiformis]|uniref:uncharacterized protein n=1 Tax=Amphiura filiformis TaxID=82378 RepID=UPI003B21AB3A
MSQTNESDICHCSHHLLGFWADPSNRLGAVVVVIDAERERYVLTNLPRRSQDKAGRNCKCRWLIILLVIIVIVIVVVVSIAVTLLNRSAQTGQKWSTWSECSVSCGTGQQIRTRMCDKDGITCPGNTTQETQICTTICTEVPNTTMPPGTSTSATQEIVWAWTSWMNWGQCDVTCDQGERLRERVCSSNVGDEDNSLCVGRPTESETCSDWPCPDCSRQCDEGTLNPACDACVCDTHTLNGFVHDADNRPLAGVTIAYEDRPYIYLVDMTDSTGTFSITGICATPTDILATKALYGDQSVLTTVVDSSTTTVDITMTRMELPMIVDNPRSKMRAVGESVAFCCSATASPPITQYEWFRNGDILEGPETSASTLILTELDLEDSGVYRCRVTNKAGSVYSNEATLTVACKDRLGLEGGWIRDDQLTASTEFVGDDPSLYEGANNGRLNRVAVPGTTGAWSAQTNDLNQWIQVAFNDPTWVTGVLIQGREDNVPLQWVTKFKVQYSDNGQDWNSVQEDMIFDGNTNPNEVVTNLFRTPVIASYIRIVPIEWEEHISLRFELLGCKACKDRLGLEDGRIRDDQITASTEFVGDDPSLYEGANNARLNRVAVPGTTGAWSAQTNDFNQWIQVALDDPTWVTGVLIQGREDPVYQQWVTKFKVQFSDNGQDWNSVQEDMIFDGNTNPNEVVTNIFLTPVRASYIRIVPTEWNAHISLRFELLGCEDNAKGCNSEPIPKLVQLPPDCVQPESGEATYDVRTCPYTSCGGIQANQTQCQDPTEYCYSVADFEMVDISCTNYQISLQRVLTCGCTVCQVLPITIYGRAVAVSDGSPLILGDILLNDEQVGRTNLRGFFDFQIFEQVTRVSLTFKDSLSKSLVETTQVINVLSGANIFVIVKMRNRPIPVEILSNVENSMSLGSTDYEPFAEIVIPPNSFYDENGDLYTGKVMAYTTSIDMRKESDLETAPGDFTAVDPEGEMIDLESFGIFMMDFTTPDDNSLSVAGSVPIYIDPNVVPAVDRDVGPDGVSDVEMWVLNKNTGVWESVSKLKSTTGRRRRKQTPKYVGEIELGNFSFFNVDGIRKRREICLVKLIPYATNSYSDVLDNARFTSAIKDTTGTDIPFGSIGIRYSSTRAGSVGTCVQVGCTKSGSLETFITGEQNGKYLIAESDPNLLAIPASILTNLNFAISTGAANNTAIKLTVPNSVVASSSPPLRQFSRWSELNTCQQSVTKDMHHFRFYLSEDTQKKTNMVEKHNTQLAETCHLGNDILETPMSFYPRDSAYNCPDDPCYLRFSVQSSRSTLCVAANSFSGTLPNNVTYGFRQVNIQPDSNGVAQVCIEYKCPGLMFDKYRNKGHDTTRVQLQILDVNNNQLSCSACSASEFVDRIAFTSPNMISACNMATVYRSSWEFTIDTLYEPSVGVYGKNVDINDKQKMDFHDPSNCEVGGTNADALTLNCD